MGWAVWHADLRYGAKCDSPVGFMCPVLESGAPDLLSLTDGPDVLGSSVLSPVSVLGRRS